MDNVIPEFKRGDRKAFNAVFDNFFQKICDFAQQISGSDAEGEQIALDTFLKLWIRRENFHTVANIKAFLYITAKNACLNFLENKKVRNARFQQLKNSYSDWQDDHLRTLMETELINEVGHEIEKLPPVRRKVFKMLYLEDKSPHEVARELGISVNTVGVHRMQAIRFLQSGPLKRKLLLLFYCLLSIFE